MITAGGTPLSGNMMDMMPKLAAIVCYGTGYDGVDLKAAKSRKITVSSPGANAAAPVADIAVILLLAATRRLLVADLMAERDWAAAKPSPMMRPRNLAWPEDRHLRDGRDRPQKSRSAWRRSRRRSAISAAAGATFPIAIFQICRCLPLVQRADDRGSRRCVLTTSSMPISSNGLGTTAVLAIARRLGHRPAGTGQCAHRQDNRCSRSRCHARNRMHRMR